MLVPIEHIRSDLLARLQAVRYKLRRRELLQGVILVTLLSLGVVLVVLILEGTFHFETSGRRVLFWSAVAGILGVMVWYVGRPLLRLFGLVRQESDAGLALMIGRAFPRINDHLLNGLQLLEEHARGFYSAVLIEAALQDLHSEIAPIDFRTGVTNTTSRTLARVLLASGAIAALLLVLFPDPFAGSAHRLWHYSEAFASPQPFSFVIEPGDKEVVKGESVAITIRIVGQQQQQLVLGSKRDREEVEERRNLDRRSDGTFHYEFVALKSTTSYTVSAGVVQSPTFRLSVVDRPVAKVLRVSLRFPPYTGLASKQLDDNVGDIVALKGTRASFFLEANKELREAVLLFGDSTRSPLRVRGTRATGDLILMKDCSYQIAEHGTERVLFRAV